MDVNSVSTLRELQSFDNSSLFQKKVEKGEENPFDLLLDSAIQMIKETTQYTNQAEEAELAYALGSNTSTADLQAAQWKANLSLQYTVAVRNAVMDAYKEIMQISF